MTETTNSLEDHLFDYSVLVEMSRMINTFMLTDELLEFSLEVFMECTGFSRGVMFVYDPEHEELFIRASRMWDVVDSFRLKRVVDDKLNYLKLRANASLLEHLEISSQEIVDLALGPNQWLVSVFPALPPVLEIYQFTFLVPLVHQGRFRGMVAMGKPVAESSFSEKRGRQLLLSLADLTSTCLENIGLREAAVIDSLTRVYTSRFFRDRVEQEIERAAYVGQTFSLIMLDVDKFKQINDMFGHLEGDRVLKQVAEVLKRTVREKIDFVGRYGGDEFVLCLFGAPLDVAVSVGERIRKEVGDEALARVGRVTVSLGVATFPTFGKNYEELIASADKGLYKSKDAGGNHVATAGDLYGERKTTYGTADYSLFIKDRVTEFYVGEYFFRRLEDELERSHRYQHFCSLVAITIDRYHTLRGLVSRRELDGILSSFSNALLVEMRKGIDFPARYLNDMIILFLPETPLDGARRFVKRMSHRLANYPFTVVEGFGPIRCNFSIASYPLDGRKAADLMQQLLELAAAADQRGNSSMAWREENGTVRIEPIPHPKNDSP